MKSLVLTLAMIGYSEIMVDIYVEKLKFTTDSMVDKFKKLVDNDTVTEKDVTGISLLKYSNGAQSAPLCP